MSNKQYRVDVWEETSGSITIRAENEEEAREKVGELINQHGLDKIFYPDSGYLAPEFAEELSNHMVGTKHTHGDREVLSCEYVGEDL